MTKNIGPIDRGIRLVLGLILLFFAWWFSSWIILAFALFSIFEAAASWCLLNQILGKNSCPLHREKK